MAKCDICENQIEETFLGKSKGTIVKINKGGKNELRHICSECQKIKSMKELKKELGD